MPKNRGRGRRRQGARRFEQKSTTRPIERPTVKNAASTTMPQKAASTTTTTQTARRQSPTQQVDTSISHVRGDLIRVGVVTAICILLLVVLWAVLR
jgi:hypothetical protein